MVWASRSQDRFTALESRVELMAGEIVELRTTVQTCQDALQASKAQVAKLEDRIARVDPSLSGPNAAHNRRYTFQPRGLKLMSLPDELLRMIVDHVATVDRPGDDEDYLLPSRFEILDHKSLDSLATTSKTMREHVRPAKWRHVCIDSPAALLRLTKGLLSGKGSCGPYVHSLKCSPLLSYRYPLSSARDILLNLYNKVRGDAALSKDAQQRACNVIQPDLFLSESQSDLFTIQALVVILPYLTALEAITAEQTFLYVLLELKADHILPARVTHLRTSGGQYVDPIDLTLAQTDSLSAQIFSMFASQRLRTQVLTLFQWEVNASKEAKYFETDIAALTIDYDYSVGCASDSASATEEFQCELNPVRNLTTLQLTSNGSYRVSPEQSLPFVSYPATLRSVHIRGKQDEVMALIAGVSHIASVEHLKVEYEGDVWGVPRALPPSLKTLKIMLPSINATRTDKIAVTKLMRKIESRRYPDSLAHLCIDQCTADHFAGPASQQSVVGALDVLGRDSSLGKEFPQFLVAVLRLDEACREHGIKLCAPSISTPLVTPTFYETLPYRLLAKVLAQVS